MPSDLKALADLAKRVRKETRAIRDGLMTLPHGFTLDEVDILARGVLELLAERAALAEACQLVMGSIGNEEGYLPSLGKIKTDRIRSLMRSAGVEPKYYEPFAKEVCRG